MAEFSPGQMVQVWVKTVSPEGRLDLTMVDESQDENMAPFKEVDKDLWLDAQISGLHNGGAFAMVQGPNGEGPVEAHIPISQIQDGFWSTQLMSWSPDKVSVCAW